MYIFGSKACPVGRLNFAFWDFLLHLSGIVNVPCGNDAFWKFAYVRIAQCLFCAVLQHDTPVIRHAILFCVLVFPLVLCCAQSAATNAQAMLYR